MNNVPKPKVDEAAQAILSSLTTPTTPEEKLNKDVLTEGAKEMNRAVQGVNNANDYVKKSEVLSTFKSGQANDANIANKAAASLDKKIEPFLERVDKMKGELTQTAKAEVDANAEKRAESTTARLRR
jgi:hypothetical protein